MPRRFTKEQVLKAARDAPLGGLRGVDAGVYIVSEPGACVDCHGTGVVNKKVWVQAGDANQMVKDGIHPAIVARRPAYRTIATSACPRCKGTKKEP